TLRFLIVWGYRKTTADRMAARRKLDQRSDWLGLAMKQRGKLEPENYQPNNGHDSHYRMRANAPRAKSNRYHQNISDRICPAQHALSHDISPAALHIRVHHIDDRAKQVNRIEPAAL